MDQMSDVTECGSDISTLSLDSDACRARELQRRTLANRKSRLIRLLGQWPGFNAMKLAYEFDTWRPFCGRLEQLASGADVYYTSARVQFHAHIALTAAFCARH